jgi:hypothetical protein
VAGEVERLRAAYAQAGYGHGHRVGLLLENRPAFFTHWLALNALGVSIVPIDAELRTAELIYLISHSEIALAVVLPAREGMLRDAASQTNVQLETIRPEAAGKIPSARSPARLGREPIGRNTECALLYTSGTTGRPKGCRLHNGYFLRAGEWYLGPARPRRGGSRHRPLHHAAAAQPHERARVLVDGGDALGRLHRPARPLPSLDVVAERARERSDGRALPRRHAGHAARRGAERSRSQAQAALLLRRRRRSAPPRRLRAALRLARSWRRGR